jgi:hypothetical protein
LDAVEQLLCLGVDLHPTEGTVRDLRSVHCKGLFFAGDPQSSVHPATPGSKLTCTAGFCEWSY